MNPAFTALTFQPLPPRTSFGDTKLPDFVHLDSPALTVMTDFTIVHPVTTRPGIAIDDALSKMKTAGVRLLLVLNDADEILGVVTANDIMGEKPIQITQKTRVPRCRITVAAVMTPQPELRVLDAARVATARVGDIVETLRVFERQHVLVVNTDPHTRTHHVIGMFSTSQISKLLGHDVTQDGRPANSLAELVEQIG
jgi:CBS domain-containing protein